MDYIFFFKYDKKVFRNQFGEKKKALFINSYQKLLAKILKNRSLKKKRKKIRLSCIFFNLITRNSIYDVNLGLNFKSNLILENKNIATFLPTVSFVMSF